MYRFYDKALVLVQEMQLANDQVRSLAQITLAGDYPSEMIHEAREAMAKTVAAQIRINVLLCDIEKQILSDTMHPKLRLVK